MQQKFFHKTLKGNGGKIITHLNKQRLCQQFVFLQYRSNIFDAIFYENKRNAEFPTF